MDFIILFFVFKELVRLMDQKKAHALCMLAEKERQRREAIEAGQRQRGNNRRREHEATYRSVCSAKQKTATNYLENILIDCFETTAEDDARHKVREVARQIDEEAEHPTSANIVAGVLNRFVLPDVFKHIAHENYLADIHQSIFQENSDDSTVVIKRFIENVVSPRVTTPSSLSSLRSGENASHHEAMHCIKKAIDQMFTFATDTKCHASGTYDVIDNIIKNIIPSSASEPMSSRSQEQEQLGEILADINETLWNYAKNDDNDNIDDCDDDEQSNID